MKIILCSLDTQDQLEGQCVIDCDENKTLIDHIKTGSVSPTGSSPVLKNLEEVQTQRGQTGTMYVTQQEAQNQTTVNSYSSVPDYFEPSITPMDCQIPS